jgi:hypothetical protein
MTTMPKNRLGSGFGPTALRVISDRRFEMADRRDALPHFISNQCGLAVSNLLRLLCSLAAGINRVFAEVLG